MKVNSSNIADITPLQPDNIVSDVLVTFNSGRVYKYVAVPNSVVNAVMMAPSVGEAFNALIRNRDYVYMEVSNTVSLTRLPVPTDEFNEYILSLERQGFAKREQDESGETRLVLLPEFARHYINWGNKKFA